MNRDRSDGLPSDEFLLRVVCITPLCNGVCAVRRPDAHVRRNESGQYHQQDQHVASNNYLIGDMVGPEQSHVGPVSVSPQTANVRAAHIFHSRESGQGPPGARQAIPEVTVLPWPWGLP